VVERNATEIKAIRNDQEIIEWAEIFGKGDMAREMLLKSKNITLDDVRAKINDERATRPRDRKARLAGPSGRHRVQTVGNALIKSDEYRSIVPNSRQKRRSSLRRTCCRATASSVRRTAARATA
jgi:hypothetical protein